MRQEPGGDGASSARTSPTFNCATWWPAHGEEVVTPPLDAGEFLAQFRIPMIAAPMTGISGLELVDAARTAGIGGSFPAHNAGQADGFDRWLRELSSRDDGSLLGPAIPNLIVHRSSDRLADDLAVVTRHQVPAVITSVGSPSEVVGPLHDAGILVLADVASLYHAERAIEAGVDGLVLLAAGAGGQTGWANPLVFARAVREMWAGTMVLAGGVVDGASLLAALVAGYDLVSVGTPFIATVESRASDSYRATVLAAGMDDIELRSDLTGLPTNMIRDESRDASSTTEAHADEYDVAVLEPGQSAGSAFSAGHSASGVRHVVTVAQFVDKIEREFREAVRRFDPPRWPPGVRL